MKVVGGCACAVLLISRLNLLFFFFISLIQSLFFFTICLV